MTTRQYRSGGKSTTRGATHSPVLAALPGSHLLQLDADGIHPVDYDDSHLVTSWRSFLSAPDRYLRHLT